MKCEHSFRAVPGAGWRCTRCDYITVTPPPTELRASYQAQRTCGSHPEVAILWEEGGPDQPTLRGRWYCPECQREFRRIMDRQHP